MSASKRLRVLSVRLPESDLGSFKSMAAQRGIRLQDAVHQAPRAWISPASKRSTGLLDALQGSLANVDVERLIGRERDAELDKEQRRLR